MKSIRLRTSAAVLALGLAFSAEGQIPQELRETLTSDFEALSEDTTPEDAEALVDSLLDADANDEDWSAFFANYFQERRFTPPLAAFWQAAIQEAEGEDQAQLALLSGIAAAAAVGRGMPDTSREGAEDLISTVTDALTWLSNIAPNLTSESGDKIFDVLEVTLRRTPGLVPAAGNPPVPSPQLAALGARLALTLRDYAVLAKRSPEAVASVLKLRDAGAHFWQAYSILILDNSALSPEQLRSLDTLLKAIPSDLHSIGALSVPRALGLSGDTWNLPLHSGQLVPIDPIPMDLPTSSGEFGPGVIPTPAPEFTIEAAQQIVRAIQSVQFARRPELVVRRDAILTSAGSRSEGYLRRTVNPSVYLDNPDELLPAVAYLWFISTPATFQTTLYLFALGQKEAFDQFLLVADLLSGGGNRTAVYVTNPAGAVTALTAPVARGPIAPTTLMDLSGGFDPRPFPAGTVYLNGIILDGIRYTFETGPGGIVSSYQTWPVG